MEQCENHTEFTMRNVNVVSLTLKETSMRKCETYEEKKIECFCLQNKKKQVDRET